MGWKTVCFKLEENLAMEFYRICDRNRVQISDVLRELIRKYVELEKHREVKEPRKIKVY